MKIYLLLSIVAMFTFGWYCKSPIAIQGDRNYGMYKVSKLDSIENVYLIYVERNDSIFKIISKKEQIENCLPLSIGKNYKLNLVSWFLPEEFHVKNRITGIKYENVLIDVERDTIVGDIFTTENLKGKCYSTSVER